MTLSKLLSGYLLTCDGFINRWESEWKTQGGGASAWLCGSSESKGVAIPLSKHFAFDINFNFSDKTGRLLTCEINRENALFHIFNIYAPNLCGVCSSILPMSSVRLLGYLSIFLSRIQLKSPKTIL
jgi:hypothetical protein